MFLFLYNRLYLPLVQHSLQKVNIFDSYFVNFLKRLVILILMGKIYLLKSEHFIMVGKTPLQQELEADILE